MTFEEWFKDNIPKEGLSENTTFSRQFVKDAFEAGQKGKVVEHFEAYGQCRDSRRIATLEKENAELKEDNGKLNRKVEILKEELLNPKDKCYSKDKDQLTKAKEIIKSFITLLTKSRTALDTKTCLMKAEQFLNSEVKK